MLIHYHAPMSRSTRIVQLIDELGATDKVETRIVGIASRRDNVLDPANPHPEGKVPLLVHDGVEIRESIAIALHLTALFPEAGLGFPPSDPRQGAVLSWTCWYGCVLEPLIVVAAGGSDSDSTRLAWRDWDAAMAYLHRGLADGRQYLTGDSYTVADLIVASTFGWKKELTPDDTLVQDWIQRCLSRPSGTRAWQKDGEIMQSLTAA